jgi:hypothetical protein
MNFYRVKEIDAEGNYVVSEVRSVLLAREWNLRIYPNPVTTGMIQIRTDAKLAGIRIIDLNGKVVRDIRFALPRDVTELNVSGLISGVYFIEVMNNKNEIYHARFIKE